MLKYIVEKAHLLRCHVAHEKVRAYFKIIQCIFLFGVATMVPKKAKRDFELSCSGRDSMHL